MYLLVHKEYKDPCFISVLRLVGELQMLVYVLVTKEFMIFFMNSPFFWTKLTCFGKKKLYLGGYTNSWPIRWVKNQLCTPLHSKVMMDNVSMCRLDAFCTFWFIHISWYLLLYLITYEAETFPVHSSIPANNKETIKIFW